MVVVVSMVPAKCRKSLGFALESKAGGYGDSRYIPGDLANDSYSSIRM